jgi:hypothetical protein
VLEGEIVDYLESGAGLIVGLVAPDGRPFATRAWLFEITDAAAGTARLLLGAGELARLGADDLAGASIAVTGADVRTFRSVQFKGTVTGVGPATRDDLAGSVRYQDSFFAAVMEMDWTQREVLDRLVPADFVTATVVITELFDQTPGPQAGARMGGDR